MATKAETSKVLKEGDKAPAFQVTADEGQKISLGEYHGKNVILFFYPKANTPG
jgi:peroxiredoxin Q/BCP